MFSRLGRVVVLVEDQDEALTFYRDVLGFEVLHDSTEGGYRFLHVGLPDQEGMGVWFMPARTPEQTARVGNQTGGEPLFVLYTDDLDRVRKRLEQHGVPVASERTDHSSRSMHFKDILGNELVAVELQ